MLKFFYEVQNTFLTFLKEIFTMDSIKFNKINCRVIAHRGLSGIECENTAAAFVAAGNRSYFGIETDMHITKDGKFAITHDASLKRCAGIDANVEELDFEQIRGIKLYDKTDGLIRSDLVIPSLAEYIRICKKYEKTAVLELKGGCSDEAYTRMVDEIRALGYLDGVIFISFGKENLLSLRRVYPEAVAQFLCNELTDENLAFIKDNGFDLDIRHIGLTKETVDLVHSLGKKINCWTVDDPLRAEELVNMGVDFITSDILE